MSEAARRALASSPTFQRLIAEDQLGDALRPLLDATRENTAQVRQLLEALKENSRQIAALAAKEAQEFPEIPPMPAPVVNIAAPDFRAITAAIDASNEKVLVGIAALQKIAFNAAQGSYTLTGRAALQKISGAAGQGSYALTGQAALKKLSVATGQGSYTLTGQDATLTFTPAGTTSYTLTASTGSYALSGQDATLTVVTAGGGGRVRAGGGAPSMNRRREEPVPLHPEWQKKYQQDADDEVAQVLLLMAA